MITGINVLSVGVLDLASTTRRRLVPNTVIHATLPTRIIYSPSILGVLVADHVLIPHDKAVNLYIKFPPRGA